MAPTRTPVSTRACPPDVLGVQPRRGGPHGRSGDVARARPGDAIRLAGSDPALQRAAAARAERRSACRRSRPTCTTSTPAPRATEGRATRAAAVLLPRPVLRLLPQHARAGWNSTHPPDGNVQESLGFLWYHDHRVDHTAENTYKGLVGPAIVFNEFDTGDETTGFHLPSFPNFDIPLVFADKLFDPGTGCSRSTRSTSTACSATCSWSTARCSRSRGAEAPLPVPAARRPVALLRVFLTNPAGLDPEIPFWVISERRQPAAAADQSHELPHRRGGAERHHHRLQRRSPSGSATHRIRLENRLEQVDGRGPTGKILPAGQGDQLLEFQLVGNAPTDNSFDPEPVSFPNVTATANDAVFAPISLPDISPSAEPRSPARSGSSGSTANGRSTGSSWTARASGSAAR